MSIYYRNPGTGEGLCVERQALADRRLAFALTGWPDQIEAVALQHLAERRDRLAVGCAGLLALGMAELFMDPRADTEFDGLRQTGR